MKLGICTLLLWLSCQLRPFDLSAELSAFSSRSNGAQGPAVEPQVLTTAKVKGVGKTHRLLLLVLAAAVALIVLLARVLSLRAAVLALLCSVATLWVLSGVSQLRSNVCSNLQQSWSLLKTAREQAES